MRKEITVVAVNVDRDDVVGHISNFAPWGRSALHVHQFDNVKCDFALHAVLDDTKGILRSRRKRNEGNVAVHHRHGR